MRTGQAEVCVAKAMRACQAHQTELDEQDTVKREKQAMQAKTKMFNLERVVRSISKANDAAEQEKDRLREELTSPVFVYTKVPGFGVPNANDLDKVDSLTACQKRCDVDNQCKSYSFNRVEGTCSRAGHTLDYNEDFVMYVKMSGPGLGTFSTIAGMKFSPEEEPDDSEESTGSSAECKFDCLRTDKCKALSYSQVTKKCIISRVPIHIGSEWDYYEKKRIRIADDLQDGVAKTNAQASLESAEKRKIWQKEVEVTAIKNKRAAKSPVLDY